MRRLHIGDRLLRVRDEGEAKKLPVVCVHGAGSSSVVWMDVVRRLQTRRRVIAPDLPGHGQSDRWHPPSDVSIDSYRDAVGTVCATLKLDKVILVGHSMGGQVALACAAAWPERVGGLVLVSTALRIPLKPRVFDVLQNDFAHASEWLQQVAWSPSTPRELVEKWRSIVFTAEQDIALADYRAIDRFDGTSLAARVRCPTLLLCGADDLLTPPSEMKQLAMALAGPARSDLLVVPRAGHMLMLEQADLFQQSLERFLVTVP